MTTATVKSLVNAIRSDSRVGYGSCTSIDEAMTDSELIEELELENITTPAAALNWAVESEGLWVELECDAVAAGGDDDRAQLLWDEFHRDNR